MKKFYFSAVLFLMAHAGWSQETWDLQKCVSYALEHNISVRQADVQARLSALQLKQSKAARIPTLGFGVNAQGSSGRSVNQSTYTYTTSNVFYNNYGLQSNVTLFNFFSIKNNIKSSAAQNEADMADINRVKSDVTLNVAAAYLQYLQSLEQVNIAKGQIDLDAHQLDLTRKQVAAGSVPELNAAQLEALLATDSSTLISNQATMNQNKLQMLALLDLGADTDFEVSLPDVDNIPLDNFDDMNPQDIYRVALQNQYQQKVDSLKILSAVYAAKSAKGQMYPTLSANASVGSNYSNQFFANRGPFYTPYTDTVGYVNANNNSPVIQQGLQQYFIPYKPSYWKQLFDINRNEVIGLTLNVPIFNNRQLRTNYEKAQANILSARLTQELNNQTLQQNIYTAYNNANAGMEQYFANTKAEQYAQYAYDLAQKRYNIGMLSSSDYLVAANKLYTAKVNRSAAHYDYIFRMKVLEYYKYNHIRLSN